MNRPAAEGPGDSSAADTTSGGGTLGVGGRLISGWLRPVGGDPPPEKPTGRNGGFAPPLPLQDEAVERRNRRDETALLDLEGFIGKPVADFLDLDVICA